MWLAGLVPGPTSAGCNGAAGGGGPVDIEVRGRVLLCILGGATVDVYGYDDLVTPIGSTTTSTGIAIGSIGFFRLTLANVRPSDLFLFVVTGG